MPALKLYGIKLKMSSDDFVIPCSVSVIVHLKWLVKKTPVKVTSYSYMHMSKQQIDILTDKER